MIARIGDRVSHGYSRNRAVASIHLTLALVFGLVLPFICWGAVATPGHPHALPHFVFVEPVMTAPVHAVDPPAGDESHFHHKGQAYGALPADGEPSPADDDLPAGQSITPSLVVMLLVCLLLAAVAFVAPRGAMSRVRGVFLFAGECVFAPLLPPPRLVSLR